MVGWFLFAGEVGLFFGGSFGVFVFLFGEFG